MRLATSRMFCGSSGFFPPPPGMSFLQEKPRRQSPRRALVERYSGLFWGVSEMRRG